MFRTLLTPLSARFALSPSSPLPEEHTQQDDFAPEDFARDVLIDLMRGFVDKLKFAETMQAKSDVSIVLYFTRYNIHVTLGPYRDPQSYA